MEGFGVMVFSKCEHKSACAIASRTFKSKSWYEYYQFFREKFAVTDYGVWICLKLEIWEFYIILEDTGYFKILWSQTTKIIVVIIRLFKDAGKNSSDSLSHTDPIPLPTYGYKRFFGRKDSNIKKPWWYDQRFKFLIQKISLEWKRHFRQFGTSTTLKSYNLNNKIILFTILTVI